MHRRRQGLREEEDRVLIEKYYAFRGESGVVYVQSLTRKSKPPSLHRSGTMACGIDHMPEVFVALCAAPGEKVQ